VPPRHNSPAALLYSRARPAFRLIHAHSARILYAALIETHIGSVSNLYRQAAQAGDVPQLTREGAPMLDIVFLAIGFACFTLAIAFAVACNQL
jgi:hypothetical protein